MYEAKDIPITKLNPPEMARMMARTALITEEHPFIPQAQGIREGALEETLLKPEGKGIPIKKARGAMSKSESDIFSQSGSQINEAKISFSHIK